MVLESKDPMRVARMVVADRWMTELERLGIYEGGGGWWVWEGGLWRVKSEGWVEAELWKWLDEAKVRVYTRTGGEIEEPFSPSIGKVENILAALRAQVRLEEWETPLWLGDQDGAPIREQTVAFRDRLVTVRSNGETEERIRGAEWFDHVVLPCNLDWTVDCPRWRKAVQEWGNGDDVWVELLQRWMGYCLVGGCKYAKGMVGFGKIRGGKGSIVRVMKRLLGPDAVMETSVSDLTGNFGLTGLSRARLLVINEMNEPDARGREELSRIWKNLLGGDAMVENRKYKEPMNRVMKAKPMLMSNEVPAMADKGSGVSGKLVMLPFDVSFVGREDYELTETLDREIPGIAMWALSGLVKLEAAGRGEKWPETDGGREAMKKFRLYNHAADAFLEECFVKNEKGFVAYEVIWQEFVAWRLRNDVQIRVSRHEMPSWLENKSSWLNLVRAPGNGHRGLNGMMGLSLRVGER